jgi:hypothetical protein
LFDKDAIDRVFEALESGDFDQRRRAGEALDEETGSSAAGSRAVVGEAAL